MVATPRTLPAISPAAREAAALLARSRTRAVALGIAGVAVLLVVLVAGVGLGEVVIRPADTVAILAHRLLGWPVTRTWSAAD